MRPRALDRCHESLRVPLGALLGRKVLLGSTRWASLAGSAYEFEGRGGTGGQLGLGNEFDYWEPTRVEWLQLDEVDWLAQRLAGDDFPAWRVLRVACGLNHSAAVVELQDGPRLQGAVT